eukprot:6316560-Amphidinium_carterae.1
MGGLHRVHRVFKRHAPPSQHCRIAQMCRLFSKSLFTHPPMAQLPRSVEGREVTRTYRKVRPFGLERTRAHSVKVSLDTKHRGYDDLIERYRNSPIMHHTVADEAKP